MLPIRKQGNGTNIQPKGWCIEKLHALLHICRNILLYGNQEVMSAQGAEHCHIEFMKNVAKLTNNKDVFKNIITFWSRTMATHSVQENLVDLINSREVNEEDDLERVMLKDFKKYSGTESEDVKNTTSLPCELGIRYPILELAKKRHLVQMTIKVYPKNIV